MEISRRNLLTGAMGLTIAPMLPSQSSAAQSNNSTSAIMKRPIIGSGEHTYEVFHDWLVPPKNLNWGDTHGVTTDTKGNIYIAHTVGSGSISKDTICVFDQSGRFIKSFGSEFAGGAHGLDLRKEGSTEYLYICDVNRRIVAKTDLNGRVEWEIDYPKESGKYASRDQWNPTNIAFAPNGDIFIGDGYGSSYVHRYTAEGKYVSTIIGPGSDKGQVSCPHGLWVDQRDKKNPKLLVADRSNNRIQQFTLDGIHLGFITEGVRKPCHIHFNHGLMLVPDLDSVVTIFGADNKPVVHLGDGHPSNLRGAPRKDYIPGKFIHPHGAAWINQRDIVVAEWVPTGRVTLLRRVG